MDDDSKKFSKGKGPKRAPAGAGDRKPRAAGAGKPGEKRFGKPAAGKPFAKGGPRADFKGGGEGRPFKPKRDYGGGPAAGAADGERKPFAKSGPRGEFKGGGEGRPFKPKRDYGDKPAPRDGEGRAPRTASADRPFRTAPRTEGRGDGERKPFAKSGGRGDFKGGGEGRPFKPKRDYGDKPAPRDAEGRAPRTASADRPFRTGPRTEGRGDGERKPFVKSGTRGEFKGGGEGRPFKPKRDFTERDGGAKREFAPRRLSEDGAGQATRPFRTGPRPERAAEPFAQGGNPRPGRGEREHGKADGFKPRSFGTKRHAAAGDSAAERPRSHGMKTHGDRAGGERGRFRKPDTDAPVETGERIAKRLARAGIASRREAEDLVSSGRVKVNGRVLSSPAFNVAVDDRIELDGTEIPPIERTRLFLFHKPAGVVTTNHDPQGRRTVFDVLPAELPRLMTIGRLDINTEGLLLLTNDGGLSRVLELPATGWLRRYRVRVHGEVDEKALADLRDGVAVDGVFYGAIEASLERTQGTNAWLSIGLREGKNREVKNVLGSLGLEVTRLIRVSFGPFQLAELPEGQVQELKGKTLRDQLGDRLIEEAGANFDAPITRPFSNKAEQTHRDERPEPARREERPTEERAGGLIKSRKRRREDSRDDALGRLSTRPERPGKFGDRGGKPAFGSKPGGAKPFGKPRAGKGEEREARVIEPPGQRKANVWMAPGARPQGGKEGGADKPAKSDAPRARSGTKTEGRRPSTTDRPRGPRKG